jgi:hypothetical protein
MFGFGGPCLPTRSKVAPSGPAWLHEIKHDGYRLMVQRTAAGVRIKTRGGFDWSDRYPLITSAAERLGGASFVLDGEGVILRPDGVSDFDRLHSRRHDGKVQLLGFDILELDGVDLLGEPFDRRKAALAGLLRGSHDGIHLVEHVKAIDGATVFAHACQLGVEGIVSKRPPGANGGPFCRASPITLRPPLHDAGAAEDHEAASGLFGSRYGRSVGTGSSAHPSHAHHAPKSFALPSSMLSAHPCCSSGACGVRNPVSAQCGSWRGPISGRCTRPTTRPPDTSTQSVSSS